LLALTGKMECRCWLPRFTFSSPKSLNVRER
jgi:hypothetical protein